jgi:predicted RNA-binding protein
MCQARVFLEEDGEEKEIMKDVIAIEVTPEGLVLKSFFDDPKEISGQIVKIDFLKHTVLVRPREEA